MNVQITPARMGAMRDLHGKVSLVTGSTMGLALASRARWQKRGPESF